MCGETYDANGQLSGRTGLSPRVRGNHHLLLAGNGPDRSIPTCAGKPSRMLRSGYQSRVYPHVCGETSGNPRHSICQSNGLSPRVRGNLVEALHWSSSTKGLSPRVRGNPIVRSGAACSDGSIPTCAGKPPRETLSLHEIGVYPHVCGETLAELQVSQCLAGLSPRVRGNRGTESGDARCDGSIPT